MGTFKHGDKGPGGKGPTKKKGQGEIHSAGNGYIREMMPDVELLPIPVLFSSPLSPNTWLRYIVVSMVPVGKKVEAVGADVRQKQKSNTQGRPGARMEAGDGGTINLWECQKV